MEKLPKRSDKSSAEAPEQHQPQGQGERERPPPRRKEKEQCQPKGKRALSQRRKWRNGTTQRRMRKAAPPTLGGAGRKTALAPLPCPGPALLTPCSCLALALCSPVPSCSVPMPSPPCSTPTQTSQVIHVVFPLCMPTTLTRKRNMKKHGKREKHRKTQ